MGQYYIGMFSWWWWKECLTMYVLLCSRCDNLCSGSWQQGKYGRNPGNCEWKLRLSYDVIFLLQTGYGTRLKDKRRWSPISSYRRWLLLRNQVLIIQSTLVISNSKGLSEILRDIRTSTYQICRIEEKLIRLTTFDKYMCNWALEVRDIVKILWKRGEIAP